MPVFSSSKIILHLFHVDNNEGKSSIGYDIIIDHDLLVQLGIFANFEHRFLQFGVFIVPMKEPSGMLWKIYLTSLDMHKMEMQTAEPFSTKEFTERLVKILGSTYAKADLEKVVTNATQINAE